MSDLESIQQGQTVLLHLNGNQTVLAAFLGENEHGFIVGHPLALVGREAGGKLQFGTAPFLTLGGELPALDSMLIPYSAILLPRVAPDKFDRLYRQALTPIDLSAAKRSPIIST
jgi:hypothetical protein